MTFVKGDVLVSQVNGQGLRKGGRYVVALVDVQRTPVGSFTRYLVHDLDAPIGTGLAKAVPFWVSNAHLLMALG